MFVAPFLLLALAALMFSWRLLRGPTVPDRVLGIDGLLATVSSAIIVVAADRSTSIVIVTVLLVSLVGFISTGALARYVERSGK